MGGSQSVQPLVLSKQIPCQDPNSSYILRSVHTEDLVVTLPDGVTTLYDNWKRAVQKYGNNQCLGARKNDGPYTFLTYNQVNQRVKNFGSGLVNLGFKPKDFLGIYSINRTEWVIAEQANNAYSFTLVPLYDTLGADAAEFIINQAQLSIIICSADKVKAVLDLTPKCPCIRTVVYFDETTPELKSQYEEKGIKLLKFEEVEKNGESNPQEPIPPKPEDVATICYTSGTTGNPKGALISHGNYVACAAGAIIHGLNLTQTDIHISYLPLAHAYERMVQISLWYFGSSLGFYRGDVLKLFDDIAQLRPTLFASVPRLYNRLYDKVMEAINKTTGLKKTLFDTAYATKLANLQYNQLTHMVWDPLVFSKIAARLGGRVRMMVTGSAPISNEVLNFLRICFSCPVLEGYGQTECGAVATLTSLSEIGFGHVGSPLCCNEIKLVDVPEMEYLSTDKPFPRGEVCYRGANVFNGYYNDPEKTTEALDKDGWLHSGDIGLFDKEGHLKIIDRKKNIFKLSQGEYIAPEKIENTYARSPLVAQSFVYGDSLKSNLIAIVVPDQEVVLNWAKEKGLPEAKDFAALCKTEQLKKAVLDSMIQVGKEGQLRGFEQVKDIYLTNQLFSVENDMLTPTFKLKRPQAKKFYQQQIDELYKHLE